MDITSQNLDINLLHQDLNIVHLAINNLHIAITGLLQRPLGGHIPPEELELGITYLVGRLGTYSSTSLDAVTSRCREGTPPGHRGILHCKVSCLGTYLVDDPSKKR
jgi:hypothetical protein